MAFSNSVGSIVFSALIQSVTYLNRNYFSNFRVGDLARYKWQNTVWEHYIRKVFNWVCYCLIGSKFGQITVLFFNMSLRYELKG